MSRSTRSSVCTKHGGSASSAKRMLRAAVRSQTARVMSAQARHVSAWGTPGAGHMTRVKKMSTSSAAQASSAKSSWFSDSCASAGSHRFMAPPMEVISTPRSAHASRISRQSSSVSNSVRATSITGNPRSAASCAFCRNESAFSPGVRYPKRIMARAPYRRGAPPALARTSPACILSIAEPGRGSAANAVVARRAGSGAEGAGGQGCRVRRSSIRKPAHLPAARALCYTT